ncbi:MAG: SRPBCC domain-containing protein [Rhizobacter sp.]
MNKRSGPRALADVSVGMIIASVDIGVPPERVFAALSTDDVITWWGDDTMYRTTEWKADVRAGGTWRSSGVGADGAAFSVGGEYLEVDPPRKLVQTWVPDWDDAGPTRLTYLLEPIEGGTRLTVRHEGFDAAHAASCRDHAAGWERVLGWLARHLHRDDAVGGFYLFRLIPPRPSFPFDITDHERRVMEEHAAYWRDKIAAGDAFVAGPVGDPAGVWGLCVVRAKDEAAMTALRDEDPAILRAIGMRYEVVPMLSAITPV